MKTRRQSILRGASVLAICVATPVAAQTVPINGGVLLPNPIITLPTDVITGGVTATGGSPSAQVRDLNTGEAAQVSQDAAPVVITNGGSLSIAATATGTGSATAVVGNVGPDVPATGTYQSALTQSHLLGDVTGATWDASATIVNTGSVGVRATAASSDGNASATVAGGIAQIASVETKGRAATALLNNSGTIDVRAAASGAGTITASIGTGGETGAPAIKQFVFSAKSPDATTTDRGAILNSGTINVLANAAPAVTGATSASANLIGGIRQQIQATGRGNSSLTATLTNNGVLNFGSSAGVGTGTVLTATAFATEALTQRAQANGGGLQSDPVTNWNDIATLTLTNNGAINLTTEAVAISSATSLIGVKAAPANFGNYGALYGSTYGPGLNQGYQNFSGPSPIISEHGVISQRGQANGWGDDVSDLTFVNAAGGTINVTAKAVASNAAGDAVARNVAAGLIVQKTQANGTGNDTAKASLTNAGRIGVSTGANSTATGGNALAVSTVTNTIQQGVEVTGPTKYSTGSGGGATFSYYTNIGQLAFTNGLTGVIDISTSATATATGGKGQAHAYVEPGVLQTGQVDGGTPQASFDNRNNMNVAASSVATGTGAFATAGTNDIVLDVGFPVEEGRLPTAHNVVGVSQVLVGLATDARFTNSGRLGVTASATANGGADGAGALASALGYSVTGEPVGITVSNSGSLSVSATATSVANAGAARIANAHATGMGFYANYQALPEIPELAEGGNGEGGGQHPAGDEAEAPAIPTYKVSGTVANTGTILVAARSSGDALLPAGGLVLPSSVLPGQTVTVGATAVGVEFVAASNTVSMQNSGTIDVSAVTNGAPAQAIGVRAVDYENMSNVQAGAADIFTLSNQGGTIRARISTNNGASYQHGVAIDTSNAPNKVVINLEAASGRNGLIYGNINLSADDEIHVRNGETVLDGVVNAGGATVGSLAIHSGGTLYLANQPHGALSTTGTPTVNLAYDGPARVNINSFAVDSGAKLAIQLPISPNSVGTYPTVVARAVTLGATSALEVRPSSWNGLYANSYYFNNVIKAPTAADLTGTFAPALVGTNTGTPLLRVQALYNQDTGGGDVDISINRVAFGAVAGLTTNQAAAGNGIEKVYSTSLTGPFAGLVGNLFQLNATAYSDALTQLSGDQYAGYVQGLHNQSLQIDNLVSGQLDCAFARQGVASCRERAGQLRIWGLAQYNDVTVDADANAAGHKSKNWSALLGADYTTGNFTIGGFGGYRETKMDFTRYGGRIDANGWQLGLTAAYDTGTYYGRVIGSYSSLNGDSRRSVNILTTAGTITGNPDARITSLYGEMGGRYQIGRSWLTPFLALDYTNVKLKAFAETGVPGANLAFGDQSDGQTSMQAGVKWAANLGGVVPEVKVAWHYDLDDQLFGANARFADAPVGSDFRVFAPRTDRSSVVAGATLAAVLGERFTGRIGYQGRFSSQLADHAVYGSLIFRFGGAN